MGPDKHSISPLVNGAVSYIMAGKQGGSPHLSVGAKTVPDPFWTRSGSGTDSGRIRDGPGPNPSGFLERVLNRSEEVPNLRPTTDEETHLNSPS